MTRKITRKSTMVRWELWEFDPLESLVDTAIKTGTLCLISLQTVLYVYFLFLSQGSKLKFSKSLFGNLLL